MVVSEMNLGEKISFFRKNKGFSQEVLAENSGVSLRTIQRIETNKSIPRPYTLSVIADALNIKIEELNDEPKLNSNSRLNSDSLSKISLINASALIVIVLPLLNIIIPLMILRNNRKNILVNEIGKKIVSFQILWTLLSLLILFISHLMNYKLTGEFVSGRIPIVILMYVFLLLINIFFILKNAIRLREGKTGVYSLIPGFF